MWSKLDDGLFDHPKILAAARDFGTDGGAKALGLFVAGLLYSNKHLTDGNLSTEVIRDAFRHLADQPIEAARIMVKNGFWEQINGVFRVHDFHDYNLHAKDVLAKRRRDRERKHRQNGGNA
jgi:hypothetical protein